MKNLFLALLAMVAFVACNNNDGLEVGFDITIGPSGEYSVSGARTVSSEEFADKVIGAGWVRKAFHYVNDNGSIDPINQDAQEDVLGYPTVFTPIPQRAFLILLIAKKLTSNFFLYDYHDGDIQIPQ